jgi:hypothetical protein
MKPDPSSFTLLDFGDMMPVDATRGSHNASGVGRDSIDVALTHGGTQFGCCPKTAAGPSNSGRRVIVGNLGNYNAGKSRAGTTGTEAADENTLSLPRDLSLLVTEDGHNTQRREILQRYVPELQSLRNESSHEVQSVTLQSTINASGGTVRVPSTTRWLGLRGKQLELLLRVAAPEPGRVLPSRFGIDVLAANSSNDDNMSATAFQRTRIAVMRDKQLLAIDRTLSGVPADADVRAGPLSFWFASSGADERDADATSTLLLHVYVDASIVTVLAGNRTAVTVHVHPDELAVGVALFAEGAGAVHMQLEGWQLLPVYAAPLPDR